MKEIEAIEELHKIRPRGGIIPQKRAESIDLAIQALEKQIQKKPRFYAHNYYCSVCNNLVGNNEFEWQILKYCDVCGQKIDWR